MKPRLSALCLTAALGGLAACKAGPRSATPNSPAAGGTSSIESSASQTAGTLQWIGGPTAILERAGVRVITDPMLGERSDAAFTLPRHPSSGVVNAPVARYTQHVPVALETLDVVIISHTHNDHVDARAKELLPKQLPVIIASAGADALRAAGFTDVRPLDWGESLTLSIRGVSLRATAVPAHHAHDRDLDQQLGRGNGYVLELADARGTYRVYWTGDAVLSEESKLLAREFGPIDLLLPHMGGVGGDGGLGLRTMNAEEALALVERIDPQLVVPIHHTTFAHYREPIEALMQRAHEREQQARFHFIREGEQMVLPQPSRSHAASASITQANSGTLAANGGRPCKIPISCQ